MVGIVGNSEKRRANFDSSSPVSKPVSYTHLDVYKRQSLPSVCLSIYLNVSVKEQLKYSDNTVMTVKTDTKS